MNEQSLTFRPVISFAATTTRPAVARCRLLGVLKKLTSHPYNNFITFMIHLKHFIYYSQTECVNMWVNPVFVTQPKRPLSSHQYRENLCDTNNATQRTICPFNVNQTLISLSSSFLVVVLVFGTNRSLARQKLTLIQWKNRPQLFENKSHITTNGRR